MSLGGGGTQYVTSNGRNYPGWAEDYILQFFGESDALSKGSYSGPSGYLAGYGVGGTNLTYAPQQPNELTGITNIAHRAQNTPTELTVAYGLIHDNLTGKNLAMMPDPVTGILDNPPDLNASFNSQAGELFQHIREVVLPAMAHSVNAIGRFGGSSHIVTRYMVAEEAIKKLDSMVKEVYYDTYKETRKQQHTSASYALIYAKESITDMEMLRQSGLFQREYVQGLYEDAYKRYQDVQQIYVKKLEIMGNAVGMLRGVNTKSTDPYYRTSDFTQMAGLALTGLGAYNKIYKGDSMFKMSDTPADPRFDGIPEVLRDYKSVDWRKDFAPASVPEAGQ